MKVGRNRRISHHARWFLAIKMLLKTAAILKCRLFVTVETGLCHSAAYWTIRSDYW